MVDRRSLRAVLLVVILVSFGAAGAQEHWPQWRGARQDGISDHAAISVVVETDDIR